MSVKTCSKCLIEKSYDAFGKQKHHKDGLRSSCNDCRNNEYLQKRYIQKCNRHNLNCDISQNQYLYFNVCVGCCEIKLRTEFISKKFSTYCLDCVKVRRKITIKTFYKNNTLNIFKRQLSGRYERKLKKRLSQNISRSIRYHINKNNETFLKYVSYTIDDLRVHLESQFEPWMNWDNWGNYVPKSWNDNDSSTWTWQLDHIIPRAMFSYTNMNDDGFKKCWSLENLRPYSAKQNVLDGISRIRHGV